MAKDEFVIQLDKNRQAYIVARRKSSPLQMAKEADKLQFRAWAEHFLANNLTFDDLRKVIDEIESE